MARRIAIVPFPRLFDIGYLVSCFFLLDMFPLVCS